MLTPTAAPPVFDAVATSNDDPTGADETALLSVDPAEL